jgi:serine phosphatase RsbU (regulator of sigma subunit)
VSPALDNCRWEQRSVDFGSGDRLLLYTDGVSEGLAGDDDFGEEAIIAIAEQSPDGGAALLDAILDRVRERFGGRPQPDDLTLLTARMTARPQ